MSASTADRPTARRGHPRGVTLVETLATAAILMMGVAAASGVVVHAVAQNRRAQTQAQAYTLAERTLERLVAVGCHDAGEDPCATLKGANRSPVTTPPEAPNEVVYWSANGLPEQVAGTAANPRRAYAVRVDVDPPFEGDETGVPALQRPLGPGGERGNVVNVRVTVEWDEPGRGRQAVALQTRVSPDAALPPEPPPVAGALAP